MTMLGLAGLAALAFVAPLRPQERTPFTDPNDPSRWEIGWVYDATLKVVCYDAPIGAYRPFLPSPLAVPPSWGPPPGYAWYFESTTSQWFLSWPPDWRGWNPADRALAPPTLDELPDYLVEEMTESVPTVWIGHRPPVDQFGYDPARVVRQFTTFARMATNGALPQRVRDADLIWRMLPGDELRPPSGEIKIVGPRRIVSGLGMTMQVGRDGPAELRIAPPVGACPRPRLGREAAVPLMRRYWERYRRLVSRSSIPTYGRGEPAFPVQVTPTSFRCSPMWRFEGMPIHDPFLEFEVDRRTGWLTYLRRRPSLTNAGFFSRPRLTFREARILARQALTRPGPSPAWTLRHQALGLEPQSRLGPSLGYPEPREKYTGRSLYSITDAVPVYRFQFTKAGAKVQVRVDARRKRVLDIALWECGRNASAARALPKG